MCATVERDFREAGVGYRWGCVQLPRALGLRLWQARPRLDKFFAVRLCEFPLARSDRAVPDVTNTLVARPGVLVEGRSVLG